MTGSISLWRSSSSSIFCTSSESQVLKQLHCFIVHSENTLFPPHGFPHRSKLYRSHGLVPSHIHAVIPEERLHDLHRTHLLCFLFVLLFDTTPRSLSRRIPGQGSQSACLQRTGIIEIPPPPGFPRPPSLRGPRPRGAVTGRKYHCQLSGAMAIQPAYD